jgi:polyisoprenoid-binding protein YceI
MNPITLAGIALVIGGTVAGAQPRDTVRVESGRASQVWIEGSSNVKDWRCQATTFDASIALMPGAVSVDAAASGLRSIDVRVPVRELKCGNRKMEHDLYAALRATDPAAPAWILARFEVVPDRVGADSIETRGALTVAGVERSVTVPVTVGRGPEGALRARGAVSLLMTDFGVKPPIGLFGLIRSRNEVTVRFDLALPPRTVAAR